MARQAAGLLPPETAPPSTARRSRSPSMDEAHERIGKRPRLEEFPAGKEMPEGFHHSFSAHVMHLLTQGKFVPLALLLSDLREEARKLETDTSESVDFVHKSGALTLRPTAESRAPKNVREDWELSIGEIMNGGINLVEAMEATAAYSTAECDAMLKFFYSIQGFHAKNDHLDDIIEILQVYQGSMRFAWFTARYSRNRERMFDISIWSGRMYEKAKEKVSDQRTRRSVYLSFPC